MATITQSQAKLIDQFLTGKAALPTDVANVAKAMSESDKIDVAVSSVETIQTFASLFSRVAATLASPVLAASMVNNVRQAIADIDDYNYIQDSTILNLAANVTTGLALLVASPLIVASTPIALAAIGIGTIGGTLLSLTALVQNEADNDISNALNGALTDLTDMMNTVGDTFGDALSDMFFPESITEDKTLEQYLSELPNGEEILESLENPEKPGIDSEVNEKFKDAIGASPRVDPMILDLDGDGVETTSTEINGVLFDGDGDGVRTSTGWVSGDDGLLVLDRNANGTIDSGRELFGDATLMPDGTVAEDGFEALSSLDSNDDGVINALDERFSELRLWQDANADGTSQSAELKSLSDFNIQSILLDKISTRQRDSGNIISATGSYVRDDGSLGEMGELDFASRPFYRNFSNKIPINDDLATLPDMHGSGQVRDLLQAASLSVPLALLLQQYAAATTRDGQQALLDELVTAWADTSDLVTFSEQAEASGVTAKFLLGSTLIEPGTPEYDEWIRKLNVIESFNGELSINLADDVELGDIVTNSFSAENAADLNKSYQIIKQSVYEGLLLQTRLQNYSNAIDYTVGLDGTFQVDFSKLQNLATADINNNLEEGLTDVIEFHQAAGRLHSNGGWQGWAVLAQRLQSLEMTNEVMAILDELHVSLAGIDGLAVNGTAANDLLLGSDSNNTINGLAGTDQLVGYGGGDELIGGDGRDIIMGGAGGDTLYGDEDSDLWFVDQSEHGDDTLLGGYGNDILYGNGGNDTLEGSIGNDTLSGGSGLDTLRGDEGDDILEGFSGNDFVHGGTGNDILQGDVGSDVYKFNLGDGQDRIEEYSRYGGIDVLRFGDGIDPGDISIVRLGNDVVLKHANGIDSVTVAGWYDNSYQQLEQVEFADGTVWDHTTLNTPGLTLNGTSGDDEIAAGDVYGETLNGFAGNDNLRGLKGNDSLNGGDGSDILVGGKGDDWLRGDLGSDTYVFETIDGHDVIEEHAIDASDIDVIKFGDYITASEVKISKQGGDLIFNNISWGDSVTVKGWYEHQENQIERVEFADGTAWSREMLNSIGEAPAGTEGDDTLVGTLGDDIINGLDGNDLISGGYGNDALSGGYGEDILNGENGNDTLQGGGYVANILNGGAGDDTLIGGYGADILNGGTGNDILGGDDDSDDRYGSGNTYNGGTGDDIIRGSNSEDIYLFGLGHGHDVVQSVSDGDYDDQNVLRFGEDIAASDIEAVRVGSSLVLKHSNGVDSVTFESWFDTVEYSNYPVKQVEFADGTLWSADTLSAVWLTLQGTSQDDVLNGGAIGGETLYGLAGNDSLDGDMGKDVLYGGDGNDSLYGGGTEDEIYVGAQDELYGGAGDDLLDGSFGEDIYVGGDGNDILGGAADSDDVWSFGNTYDGGQGDDLLRGTAYGDLYLFSANNGHDRIREHFYMGDDTLRFETDTEADQLWFSQVGDDLNISVIGTNNQVTVENWYSGPSFTVPGIDIAMAEQMGWLDPAHARIERIELSNGQVLLENQVQQLVDAMASFSPPPSGQTSLSQAMAQDLEPVIAASWQSSAA